MSTDPVAEIYGQVGGEGIGKLVASFYAGVKTDSILGPLYQKAMQERGEPDLQGAEDRLREYLIGRFGGPPTYVEKYGHPRLRARHFPFVIDQNGRDRWMQIMEKALNERGFPQSVHDEMKRFFTQLSQHMINT